MWTRRKEKVDAGTYRDYSETSHNCPGTFSNLRPRPLLHSLHCALSSPGSQRVHTQCPESSSSPHPYWGGGHWNYQHDGGEPPRRHRCLPCGNECSDRSDLAVSCTAPHTLKKRYYRYLCYCQYQGLFCYPSIVHFLIYIIYFCLRRLTGFLTSHWSLLYQL